MTASDFSGLDLSIEPVRGVRSFQVDRLGRLTGVSCADVWKPGENVAVCHRGDGRSLAAYIPYMGSLTLGSLTLGGVASNARPVTPTDINRLRGLVLGASTEAPVAPEPDTHDMSACGHGFYAYYDGSNDYAAGDRVSAVIEGYGETVIGTRGFRSAKARIVALCPPKGAEVKPEPRRGRILRLRHWFDDHFRATGLLIIAGVMLTLAALTGAVLSYAQHWEWWLALTFTALVPVLGAATSFMMSADLAFLKCCGRRNYTATRDVIGLAATTELLAKVRRNYPDVPWFDSIEAMVEAFPPDQPSEPSPETDPDFWERSA